MQIEHGSTVEVSDFSDDIQIYQFYDINVYIYICRWCIYIYRWYLYISTYFETSFFLVALNGCLECMNLSNLDSFKPVAVEAVARFRGAATTSFVHCHCAGGVFWRMIWWDLAVPKQKKTAPTFGRFFQPQVVVFLVIVHLIWIKDPINPHVFFFQNMRHLMWLVHCLG